ncbi:hypothetical protein [Pallidibacillus thermolactis]|jgi:hypothetical protein|uniref:hypothetical protein n=1 Tax=Pallidibacillus thermolactis TaxID=251051 RepID=UPI0021D8C9C0|nr:hypothetical protein [Pallidibacillus thermolactis]MCU9601383.1 hypothetical protein [Pallidibacillus thermolactis subsp. kokeshiiformis]
MKNINCRGPKCRERLVENYIIKPTAHTKLLEGQSKQSCTGQILKDTYYLFEYVNKHDPTDSGGFYCGYHAAEHFLNLIQHDGLPLFNPLIQDIITTENSNKSNENSNKTNENNNKSINEVSAFNSSENSKDKKKWNHTAKQLYNAINLLIICWDTPIYGPLAKYKADLEKYYYCEPFFERIKFVNRIIGKDYKNRTLTQMLNDLRKNNPKLKHFQFDLLEEKLRERGIESRF